MLYLSVFGCVLVVMLFVCMWVIRLFLMYLLDMELIIRLFLCIVSIVFLGCGDEFYVFMIVMSSMWCFFLS